MKNSQISQEKVDQALIVVKAIQARLDNIRHIVADISKEVSILEKAEK